MLHRIAHDHAQCCGPPGRGTHCWGPASSQPAQHSTARVTTAASARAHASTNTAGCTELRWLHCALRSAFFTSSLRQVCHCIQLQRRYTQNPAVAAWSDTHILHPESQQAHIIVVPLQAAECFCCCFQDLCELLPAGLCAVLILGPLYVPAAAAHARWGHMPQQFQVQ